MGQSPHQLMYNLYNVIALTEIKGFAMVQFAYMMLRLYNKGNFTLESELARRTFESQAMDKLLSMKKVLPKMSRDFWRCDADIQVEGDTYVRLTNLLQVRSLQMQVAPAPRTGNESYFRRVIVFDRSGHH
jgi:hypothetical protein